MMPLATPHTAQSEIGCGSAPRRRASRMTRATPTYTPSAAKIPNACSVNGPSVRPGRWKYPLAGGLADALEMIQAQNDSGLMVAIGYQWSFSRAIQALK